jgi:hypothetical protein
MMNGTKLLRSLVCAALILQSLGCGTITHPERKGQKAGRIDVAIAVLDGIGLLFFIIPGVIAFAVDFNNGTIYLPKGDKGLLNRNDLEKLRFEPGPGAKARVERLLLERTGRRVALEQPGVEAFRLGSPDDIPEMLARAY